MSTTTDNRTLKERIVDILDNQDYWIDYDFDTKQAANAIEELFRNELENFVRYFRSEDKPFTNLLYMQEKYNEKILSEKSIVTEYLNSITTDTKSLTKED